MGVYEVYLLYVENWFDILYYEFFVDIMWSDFVYGCNVVYLEGYYGNVVLLCYFIEYYENCDVLVDGVEKCGVFYCCIVLLMIGKVIYVMCVYLGLCEVYCQVQFVMFVEWVNELLDGELVLVVGDFNDWR